MDRSLSFAVLRKPFCGAGIICNAIADQIMPSTLNKAEVNKRWKASTRWLLWLLAAVILVLVYFLRFGGELLVAGDSMPKNANAAVILQGSTTGEKARIAGAMRLLQQGVVNQALLSV